MNQNIRLQVYALSVKFNPCVDFYRLSLALRCNWQIVFIVCSELLKNNEVDGDHKVVVMTGGCHTASLFKPTTSIDATKCISHLIIHYK